MTKDIPCAIIKITVKKRGKAIAYNEQIKNLKNVRSYIRQFFVGGFKEAKDYTYDNQENKTDGKTSKSNFRYIKKRLIIVLANL